MAVPKKRMSPRKRDQRRAHHDKVAAPNLSPCPNCEELTLSHRVCPACGQDRGRQVVEVAQE
ncbi:MAG TPA: 50S ribosomal protein L32 [Nannocystaceae bacterium]|nr:50S ribosomal protein L32 [Nannocystaceae bacterium]